MFEILGRAKTESRRVGIYCTSKLGRWCSVLLLPYLLTKLRDERLTASFVLEVVARDSTKSGGTGFKPAPRQYFDWATSALVVSTPALDFNHVRELGQDPAPPWDGAWWEVRLHAGIGTRQAEAQFGEKEQRVGKGEGK